MSEDLNTQIKIGADASGVEAGVSRAKRSLKGLGDAAKAAGKDGGAGIGQIGADGDKAAKKVESATRSMQNSIQRLIAEQTAGGKSSRAYYEALADTKGINRNAIKPLLDQLDAAKAKTIAAESATNSWRSSLDRVGPAMAAAFSLAALGAVAGKVVAVQREFDVLNASLKTVTGSSAAAERELAWLKDFAKETPFGLAQATQGFVKMKALGLDPTRASLTSFGNTASALGKNLNQMIEAVADASTGEFERLKEFGIKARQQGTEVSLTFQGITKTIGNNAAEITRYLEDIGNVEFAGAMAERAKTLDGAISALGDLWDELFRTVSSGNVGGLIFDSVTLANGAIEDATNILSAMAGATNEVSKSTGALVALQSGVGTFFETVAVLSANALYVLRQTGDTLGGVAAGYKEFFSFNFEGVREIGRQMRENSEAARREIDATTERILNARSQVARFSELAARGAGMDEPRFARLMNPVNAPASTPARTAVASKPIAAANRELEAQAKLLLEINGLTGSFYDDWDRLGAVFKAGKISLEQLTSEQAKLLAKQPAIKQGIDAEAKAATEAAAARESYIKSLTSGLEKIQADTAAQIEATQRMGLSKEAVAALDVAKLEMIATDLELQAIKVRDVPLDERAVELLKQQANAYRDLAKAKQGGAAREAAIDAQQASEKAAQDARSEWQKTTDSINESLTDALLRGFESGKDFAKNLRDTVVNMFKTMVLRPVISAIVNPVAGALTGALGFSGAANAAGGGGGLGGMLGTASNLSSLMNLNTAGALGGLLSSSAAYGAAIGTSSIAAGSQAAMLAAQTGTFGAAGLKATSIAASGAGSGAASTMAAVAPWLLGVALLASFTKKSTPHTGGVGAYSAASGATTGSSADLAFALDQKDYNQAGEDLSTGVAKSIVGILDATATTFGKQAGYYAATAFADDSSKDGAWGALRIKLGEKVLLDWADTAGRDANIPRVFADGEAGSKEYLAAVAKSARDALVGAIGDVDWATDMLKGLGESVSLESLAQTVQQINAAKAAFVGFGQYMPVFAAQSDAVASAMAKASGGVDALAGNMSVFVDAYYSDAEKLAVSTGNVRTAIEALGLEMPTTRDAFRAMVEEQIALGTEGAAAAAGLLAVSGAFAAVASAAEAAASGAEQTATRLGLERQILELTGDTAAIRLLEIAGMNDANVALFDRVAALGAEKAATEAATEAAGALARANQGIRDQIDVLTGAQTQRSLQLRDTPDASTRALLSQLFATEDLQAANEAVAAAEEALADARKASASAAAESARATIESTFAAQSAAIDAQRATAKASQSAAQALITELQSVFDTLQSSVRDLYQDVLSTAAMSAAAGKQFIDNALASARATGYLPDNKALGDAIAAARGGMGDDQYATVADRDRDRLVLAGKLSELASIAQPQLSAAEQSIKLADAQLEQLEQQADALDNLLRAAQEELDVLRGIGTGTTTVASAIDALRLTVFAELQAQTTALAASLIAAVAAGSMRPQDAVNQYEKQTGTTVVRDQWTDAAGTQAWFDKSGAAAVGGSAVKGAVPTDPRSAAIFGIAGQRSTVGDAQDFIAAALASGDLLSIYNTARAYGISSSAVDALGGFAPGTALQWALANGLPAFERGTNYTREGLAYLHEGEAIVPKAYNPAANPGMGGNTERLEKLVEGLTAEVQRLQSVVATGNRHAERTATVLDDAARGKQPLSTAV